MSDIVDLLQSLSGQSSDDLGIIGATAADEIKVLRQRVKELEEDANDGRTD